MATIHFYEKTGCANNTRQKQLLSKAGHLLIVHDLLEHPWTKEPDKLRSFFGDKPVREWFNQSAPAIKHGLIDMRTLTEQQAVDLMLFDPLLIKRPLLEVGGKRHAGFDPDEIEAFLGLALAEPIPDLETCQKPVGHQGCTPYSHAGAWER